MEELYMQIEGDEEEAAVACDALCPCSFKSKTWRERSEELRALCARQVVVPIALLCFSDLSESLGVSCV